MEEPPASLSSLPVTQQQFEAVRDWLLPKLARELPHFLLYHNVDHVKGVIHDASYLLAKENVSEEEKWLLLTAALFHDSGFLHTYKNHERVSCDLAKSILPLFDYGQGSIEAICTMITATEIPQTPQNHCSQILCDADLFYLGTSNFFAIAEMLFQERKGLGFVGSRDEWNREQLKFLSAHRYFTQTAIRELEPRKKQIIEELLQASL